MPQPASQEVLTELTAAIVCSSNRRLASPPPKSVAELLLKVTFINVGSLLRLASPPPYWRAAAEQGLHGLHLAEAVGGQGFGLLELAIGLCGAILPFLLGGLHLIDGWAYRHWGQNFAVWQVPWMRNSARKPVHSPTMSGPITNDQPTEHP